MRRLAIALALLGFASPSQAQLPVREKTTTYVDLVFVDGNGVPTLPQSVDYHLDDVDSRYNLLAATTIASPGAQPCPDNAPGCVTLTIPAANIIIVGICKGTTGRACRTSADCPGAVACRASTEAFANNELTVHWLFPGGEANQRVILRTQNLAFVQ